MKVYCCSQLFYFPLPRTAIEAEILFAARIMQVRFFGAVKRKNTAGTKQQRQKDWSEKRGAAFCFL